MIEDGYYVSAGSDHWFLSVSFRSPEEMCTEQISSEQIGDRLVVNQVFLLGTQQCSEALSD